MSTILRFGDLIEWFTNRATRLLSAVASILKHYVVLIIIYYHYYYYYYYYYLAQPLLPSYQLTGEHPFADCVTKVAVISSLKCKQ
jgi:hypothetical protein